MKHNVLQIIFCYSFYVDYFKLPNTLSMIVGNQRPTRMDGLMSNEGSHSAATVRAVSIASVPGYRLFLQTNKVLKN